MQQSNDVVVDSAPGSGGDMGSCGKLCGNYDPMLFFSKLSEGQHNSCSNLELVHVLCCKVHVFNVILLSPSSHLCPRAEETLRFPLVLH